MKMLRRQLLGLGICGAATMLTGCETLEQQFTRPRLASDAFTPAISATSPMRRLLNRATFGPRPGDLAHAAKQELTAYIDAQLRPEMIAEDPILTVRLRPFGDILNADAGTLFDIDDHQLVTALRQATVLRAVYSRRQLYERMVEFWSDHFNIYAFKGEGAQLKVIDDRDVIRAHALGRFRDLLGASARSAAMLTFLDNGSNRKGVPNENYARELMELHTLGVQSGYTQRDVQEVARCFTGWTVDRQWHRGQFTFEASWHDAGVKRVLGQTLPADGGIADGEQVLDMLAAHPATAYHLARKLCRRFLGIEPQNLVQSLASVYLATGGDIKSVLRSLLLSPELATASPILKRPFDYVVSCLRVLNSDTDGGAPLQTHLEKMGQPLFAWPMPDGFPDRTSAWTGSLLPRWRFALALAGGQIQNTRVDWEGLIDSGRRSGLQPYDTLQDLVFEGADVPATPVTHSRDAGCSAEFGAMLLMSPDFQWR